MSEKETTSVRDTEQVGKIHVARKGTFDLNLLISKHQEYLGESNDYLPTTQMKLNLSQLKAAAR